VSETEQPDPAFERLLEFLRSNRGFDFTGYKRASLERRIRKRMHEVGVREFDYYLDYLEVHPDEFTELFNTILINVTGFFRDPPTWELLREEMTPALLSRRAGSEPIRVWVAGCATGEEACTLAITLAEVMDEEQFRHRVKIFATDVDEEALTQARTATYDHHTLEPVPDELRERYFDPANGGYQLKKELRRAVIFGRNDLVQDAPISGIDLLTCRNTLMYFNAETQSRILGHFHFGLHDDGYLVLGKSEMLLTHGDLFTPLDQRRRIFVKVMRPGRERPVHKETSEAPTAEDVGEFRDLMVESEPVARIVVSDSGDVLLVNNLARDTFGLDGEIVGRPLRDLEVSYRPVDLRSMIDRAIETRLTVREHSVPWREGPSGDRHLDIEVVPLFSGSGTLIGAGISFVDVTNHLLLQRELETSKRELEAAYEELQSTVEELETTNEELQSTNEELETLNEELQSTNEELETTNEELQSTNSELESVNEEMATRTMAMDNLNSFLESILGSFRVAVLVVDRDLRVLEWNPQAEELWGLRRDEVLGKHLLGLDMGLALDQLGQPLRSALAGEARGLVMEATNRRGRTVRVRVSLNPLTRGPESMEGAIVLMEDQGAGGADSE
jgi:two-component system, chemotaxis family, CheB/CheR fusion protein